MGVDGELRDAVLAHQRFQVGPHAVGALGEHALALVEHLVEDHDALVGQPDLVGVRVHQRPADVAGVPVLDGGVQLPADVLDRLLDVREKRFQAREDRLDRHRKRAFVGDTPRAGRTREGQGQSSSLTGEPGSGGPRDLRTERAAHRDEPCAPGRPAGDAQADTGRCIRIDWSSPMAIQTANIEEPP